MDNKKKGNEEILLIRFYFKRTLWKAKFGYIIIAVNHFD